jgi:GTPase SAR1 family protein
MLVGNKMDLEQQREVTTEEARDFAKQYSIPYMECSAKSGQSINEAF